MRAALEFYLLKISGDGIDGDTKSFIRKTSFVRKTTHAVSRYFSYQKIAVSLYSTLKTGFSLFVDFIRKWPKMPENRSFFVIFRKRRKIILSKWTLFAGFRQNLTKVNRFLNKDKIGQKNIKYKTDNEKLRKSEIRKLIYGFFQPQKHKIIIATKAQRHEEFRRRNVEKGKIRKRDLTPLIKQVIWW